MSSNQWYFVSQPVNIACSQSILPQDLLLHETIFKQTSNCSIDNHYEVEGETLIQYRDCRVTTSRSCDLDCKKTRIVPSGFVIADSPQQWDGSCQTIATQIPPTTIYETPGKFTNYSVFGGSPGSFVQVNRFPLSSNCVGSALDQIHLYAKYDSCTAIKDQFVISAFANNTLSQGLCSDSLCQVCQWFPINITRSDCVQSNGYLYSYAGTHKYKSLWTGNTVQEPKNVSQETPLVLILTTVSIFILVFIGIMFIKLFYRKRQLNLLTKTNKDGIKTAVLRRIESVKQNEHLSPRSSVSPFLPNTLHSNPSLLSMNTYTSDGSQTIRFGDVNEHGECPFRPRSMTILRS